ncbi:hypothetical protein ACB098_09G090700 [Castanea mollissima]
MGESESFVFKRKRRSAPLSHYSHSFILHHQQRPNPPPSDNSQIFHSFPCVSLHVSSSHSPPLFLLHLSFLFNPPCLNRLSLSLPPKTLYFMFCSVKTEIGFS